MSSSSSSSSIGSSSSSTIIPYSSNDTQPAVLLSSKHKMPLLGFGTWGAGDSASCLGAAVVAALKAGYRHVDCAEYYKNQKEIGDAVQHYLKNEEAEAAKKSTDEEKRAYVKREDLFFTTKVWNTNHRPDHVKQSVKKSLKDLGLSYLDLVLVHWPLAWSYTGAEFELEGGGFPRGSDGVSLSWSNVPLSATWSALEELVDEGLVRSIGISNYPLISVIDLLSYARIRPAVHQVELHPYLSQSELVSFCAASNIHVSAYCPLGRPGKFSDCVLDDVTVRRLAASLNISPAVLLLAWQIRAGRSPLPKSSNEARIKENFQATKVYAELDKTVLGQVDALNKNHRYVNIVLSGPNAGTFGTKKGHTLFE